MNLYALKKTLTPKQYAALAGKAETSPGYLDQIAWGHRKPSPKLARKLTAANRRLTLEDLRPDIYGAA